MISVFTPLSKSGNSFIREAYDSLRSQTYGDFEWLVLPNNGGVLPSDIREDSHVRVLKHMGENGIGALKRRCCNEAQRQYLFEFDHDDVLHPRALEKTLDTFAKESSGFVYSDFCEFKHQGVGYQANAYDGFGWENYPVEFREHMLLAMRAPEPTPQNIRKVEWAPNHLRAWSREAYDRAGGHDPSLPVADDHDLVVRTYLAGSRLTHLPECLYFYRVHAEQAVQRRNAQIQELDWNVYERHVEGLAKKFAKDGGLRAVDLCGGINPREGYEPLDISLGHDLNGPWPLEDSSVGVMRASDAIEHLRDPVHTMNEAWRVLAPGGFFFTLTPSTDGRGAFQDPTHVSFWNSNSFWYYTNASLQKYVPAIKARFQVARIRNVFLSDWHKLHQIPYVEAQLIALKDGYRPMGEVLI